MTIIDRIIAEYQHSPRIVAVLRQKRWLLLSEPEDVRQCVELSRLMHPTSERGQATELVYLLADLASQPHAGQTLRRRPKKPRKPRKSRATGRPRYRWTSEEAREIAPVGNAARDKKLGSKRIREIYLANFAKGTRTANLPEEKRRELSRLAICRRWHGGDGTNCTKCEQARARREAKNADQNQTR